MQLTINDTLYEVRHEDEPLVWVLRDELGLTGTHYGCGVGECGCCTVLVDGAPVRSCRTTPREVGAGAVVTLEGLARPGPDGEPELHPAQQAFLDDPLQCGWCLPGHILCAAALIAASPDPTDEQIEASADVNLCRCGGYNAIRRNVRAAAELARRR